MGLFGRRKVEPDEEFPVDEPATPGRPEGRTGDTGRAFAMHYGAAQNTLMHAGRDDDPRCQRVLCQEARDDTDLARIAARNSRQREMARLLLEAVESVDRIAAVTPPLAQPHQHNVLDQL